MMECAIQTRNLVRRYAKKTVINGLELSVPTGSVYGFLGRNGAGKTTTIRMLMGLIRRHGGEVSVLGLDPERDSVKVKSRVGYVPESPEFYEWLSVEKTIGLVANYQKNWDDSLAERLVKDYGLDLKAKVKALSKGTWAKLTLLLALAHRPEVLILDEPTGGLDPAMRREFFESVLRALPEQGCTVFISSHLVNEIAPLVDRVGFLRDGKLLVTDETENLLEKVKRIHAVFASGQVPERIVCSGLLRMERREREAIITVSDFDQTRTLGEIAQHSPTDVTVESLTLEDIFVELLPD